MTASPQPQPQPQPQPPSACLSALADIELRPWPICGGLTLDDAG